MTLLETMSNILGMPIREGKWRQYVSMLDREGKITKRVQLDMILALCEKVSELESSLSQPQAFVGGFTVSEPLEAPKLTPEEELKLKRQANIKKAQEARRKKYELKRAASQQNA